MCSAMASLHMQMRARYFVITSKSTWTSTVAVFARVYGFATETVFVIDIEEKQSSPLASIARSGSSLSGSVTKGTEVDEKKLVENVKKEVLVSTKGATNDKKEVMEKDGEPDNQDDDESSAKAPTRTDAKSSTNGKPKEVKDDKKELTERVGSSINGKQKEASGDEKEVTERVGGLNHQTDAKSSINGKPKEATNDKMEVVEKDGEPDNQDDDESSAKAPTRTDAKSSTNGKPKEVKDDKKELTERVGSSINGKQKEASGDEKEVTERVGGSNHQTDAKSSVNGKPKAAKGGKKEVVEKDGEPDNQEDIESSAKTPSPSKAPTRSPLEQSPGPTEEMETSKEND